MASTSFFLATSFLLLSLATIGSAGDYSYTPNAQHTVDGPKYTQPDKHKFDNIPKLPKLEFPKPEYEHVPKPDVPKPEYEHAPKPDVPKPEYEHVPKPYIPKLEVPKPNYEHVPKPDAPKPDVPKLDYEYIPKPDVPKPKYENIPKLDLPEPEVTKPEYEHVPKLDVPKPEVPKPEYEHVPKPEVPKPSKPEYEQVPKPEYSKPKLPESEYKHVPQSEIPNPKPTTPEYDNEYAPKPTIPKHDNYQPEYNRIPEEKPLDTGIEGLVLCKSGSKYIPIKGAVARIVCSGVDENGYETTPFSCLTGETNAKGYFLKTFSLELDDKFKLTECKAYLESSPLETCNVPTDVNKGISGALLSSYRILNINKLKLYSVGPFFFTPESESTSTPTGY